MKTYIFSIVLLVAIPSFGQKKKKDAAPINASETPTYQVQKKVFEKALTFGDYLVAKNALYEMIALDTANKLLEDTLCMLYFQAGEPTQCVLLSEEILERDPEKASIRNLKAISEKSLGLLKEALKDFELLYASSPEVDYLYQICTIQYELKRYGECVASAEKIIADESSATKKINIATKQSRQMVSLKAAAINIKGVVFLEMGKKEEAKKAFEQALSLAPDFELAKNNLTVLSESEGKK